MASTSRSFSVTSLVWAPTAGAAVATGMVMLADRLWPGDMLTFFQPVLALAVLVLLLLAGLCRRWIAAAALVVMLCLVALPLFVPTVPTAPAAQARDLRIVTANVLFNNPTPERFAEIVADLSPDIIVTQEARHRWREALNALPGYHLVGREIHRWNSTLVLSRYPARGRAVPDIPNSGFSFGGGLAIRVEVDVPQLDQPLVVYAIHAPTPRSNAGWKARGLYLDAVARQVASEAEGTPVLLAGDWNTPFWSPAFGRTLLLSGLEATERSAWPPATRLFKGPFGLTIGTPIDRVAVSRGIGVADIFPGPDFNSDHLPVVVDLKLP